MPWLKLDTALPNHPKVRKLDLLLGRHGNGLAVIVSLWCWADHYAPSGDITRHAIDDLAIACSVDPKRVDILSALISAGFVDATEDHRFVLHDWSEHQGAAIELRSRNADRARAWRERHERARNANGTHTERVAYAQRAGQEEKRGEEKREEVPPPSPPSPAGPARVVRLDPISDPEFVAFWAAYPRKAAKRDAAKAWRQMAGRMPKLDALLAALAEQSRSAQWTRDDGQKIPYPATWLRGERWTDALDVPLVSSSRRNPHPIHPDDREALLRKSRGTVIDNDEAFR